MERFHMSPDEFYKNVPRTPPKGPSGISPKPAGVNPVPTKLNEKSRVYRFPGFEGKVALENVTELLVSASGNHHLKTVDGKLHIVSPGWMHIEIDPGTEQEWTV
jgi:hypothetical protein